jgi:mannitol/fructose-specific phosphotransferase system IIA component (Ntr-type)
MNILDILSPNAVRVPLASTDKKSVIEELVDLLAQHHLVTDAPTLKRVIWERERQRSTGIGEGLAIPHGKCTCSRGLVMAIGRPAEPIEFDAIDKRPVRLVILLASPPDKTSEHVQALGKISRLMANPRFREQAYAAPNAAALFDMFREAEAAEPARR